MADDSKETKKKIWYKKQEIQRIQSDRDNWAVELPNAERALEVAENDVQRAENAEIKAEIERTVAEHDANIAKLQGELAELQALLPQAPEPAVPKFDPEKHPQLRKNFEKAEPAKPVIYNTGDVCEAQWVDKAWYKAKVQTILGSASAPKYHIKFLEYDETMTVDRDGLRPLQHKRKREMDNIPPPPPQTGPVTSSPHVISGPASINPEAQAAKKQVAEAVNPPKNRRKTGSNKELQKRANSWKDFTSKGVGKKSMKESMFRSGTTVNSRVGFTGSGAGMTQTTKRVRYNHKADAAREVDEDD